MLVLRFESNTKHKSWQSHAFRDEVDLNWVVERIDDAVENWVVVGLIDVVVLRKLVALDTVVESESGWVEMIVDDEMMSEVWSWVAVGIVEVDEEVVVVIVVNLTVVDDDGVFVVGGTFKPQKAFLIFSVLFLDGVSLFKKHFFSAILYV